MAQSGDAVVEQAAAGGDQLGQPLRVHLDLSITDVLDHADRGDRIEALAGDLAIVLGPDLDPVGDAGLCDPAPRLAGLGLGKGYADRLHTCLLYTSDAADDLLCVDLG